MVERLLLVLDLDETLIHATETPLAHAYDHEIKPYFLYRRPGLSEFIREVSQEFRLAVWTSSSPAYAHAVCPLIFPDSALLEFVWASDRCTLTRNFDVDAWDKAKPLRKLKRRGYDLAKVLVVDDSPEKHTRNYGNLVQVTPFMGKKDDDELAVLARYLKGLSTERNVRAIEKRQWRRRMETHEKLGSHEEKDFNATRF
jgi:carboxy-terminal domain RNA polymerase II polypeptide A small phosphatase